MNHIGRCTVELPALVALTLLALCPRFRTGKSPQHQVPDHRARTCERQGEPTAGETG